MSAEGHRIFSIKKAREFSPKVGLADSYVTQALFYLKQGGWITSLRRGLYAISTSTPGVAPTHEFEVAMSLVNPAAVSHWSALHHHGLTEQATHDIFVLTTTEASVPRVRGKKRSAREKGYRVGDVMYRFVQVKPERFFGVQKIWVGDGRVTITDPERTLLDGLAMPQYCGDFAEVLHGFQSRGSDLDLARIIDYALRLDAALAKRLGWVLEREGVDPVKLDALLKAPIKGYRLLDPSGPRIGPYNSRWMIQENLPGRSPS